MVSDSIEQRMMLSMIPVRFTRTPSNSLPLGQILVQKILLPCLYVDHKIDVGLMLCSCDKVRVMSSCIIWTLLVSDDDEELIIIIILIATTIIIMIRMGIATDDNILCTYILF